MEAASYEKICREMGVDVKRVTFMTDNVKGTFTLHRAVNPKAPIYLRPLPSGRSSQPYTPRVLISTSIPSPTRP
jgi:hypothetical protein